MAAPAPPFLRRIEKRPDFPADGHPFDLAAVQDVERIPFAPVTFFVGDNGTGKSTLTEAVAIGAGFNAEGGGRNLSFATLDTHTALHRHLDFAWATRPKWGWFLRAETFYGMATHIALDDHPKYGLAGIFPDFHGESHGESFLDLAQSRFTTPGLYILDEPEAALSLQGQLKLLRIIFDSCGTGSQFVIATHSPVLMALPGATIVEFLDRGLAVVPYDDLGVVQLWRQYLAEPDSFLRHLLSDDDD